MNNPFDIILERLNELDEKISKIQTPAVVVSIPEKVISEKQLCKYLNITPPTAQKWRKKGKIPFMQIGTAIRYDIQKVIDAIEENSKNKPGANRA